MGIWGLHSAKHRLKAHFEAFLLLSWDSRVHHGGMVCSRAFAVDLGLALDRKQDWRSSSVLDDGVEASHFRLDARPRRVG